MVSHRIIFILLFIFSIITYQSAYASSARDASGQAQKKMQFMMRQLASEKDAALAEVAKLKKELAGLEKKIKKSNKNKDGLAKKLDRTEKVLAKFKENNEKMRNRIFQDREKAMEMVEKFRETVTVLRTREKENNQLNSELKNYKVNLERCSNKNDNMYQANIELLEAYNNKSVLDSFMEIEPFTGLKKVESEIASQEKTEQLNDLLFVTNE